jgi:Zn finger protein HypA/HybF involved in hydrogenase expression
MKLIGDYHMHELGILKHAIKTVNDISEKNDIEKIKFITLEVGKDSSFVPIFFEKLFPVAIEGMERFQNAILNIEVVDGKGLIIKEIGY